jgi:hypothetical protein
MTEAQIKRLEQLLALLDAHTNAQWDCAEFQDWGDEDEPYEVLHDRAELAEANLKAELRKLVIEAVK